MSLCPHCREDCIGYFARFESRVVPVIVLVVAHEMTLHRRPPVPTTASDVACSKRWALGFAIVVVLVAVAALALTVPPRG